MERFASCWEPTAGESGEDVEGFLGQLVEDLAQFVLVQELGLVRVIQPRQQRTPNLCCKSNQESQH